MDEFDIAKFLEEESLLNELVEGLRDQIRVPFVEQRLANGFKENLEEERNDLIKKVQKREDQISMLLQFFCSLTEVGIGKIQELNYECSCINEEIQSSKFELQTLENHLSKLQDQERKLELGNEKVEEEIERLQKAHLKLIEEAKIRRAEIEELLATEKIATNKAGNKMQRASTVSDLNASSKNQQQAIKVLEKKNTALEKVGRLLAEQLNRLKLRKEQEDYYKELCLFTENELEPIRKVFDQDIPGYESKIKKLREECVALQLEMIELAPFETTRNTVGYSLRSPKKPLADSVRKERKTLSNFKSQKAKGNYVIDEAEEPMSTLPDETPKKEQKFSFNETISVRESKTAPVINRNRLLESDSESDNDDDNEKTQLRQGELFSVNLTKTNATLEQSNQKDPKNTRPKRDSRGAFSITGQQEKENEEGSLIGSHKAKDFVYGEASSFLYPNDNNSVTDLESNTKNSTREASVKEPMVDTSRPSVEKLSFGTQTQSLESENKTEESSPTKNLASQVQTSKKGNDTSRSDPTKEFFIMTCQCAKLNSQFFDQISFFPTDHYYERLIQQKVPFNKWYEWVQRTLEAKVIQKKKPQQQNKLKGTQ